jgi:hypothetical protein
MVVPCIRCDRAVIWHQPTRSWLLLASIGDFRADWYCGTGGHVPLHGLS